MHWLLGLVFGVMGAVLGGAGTMLLGLGAGFALGWLGWRLKVLGERAERLERALERLASVRSDAAVEELAPRPAAAPATAPLPATVPPAASETRPDTAAAEPAPAGPIEVDRTAPAAVTPPPPPAEPTIGAAAPPPRRGGTGPGERRPATWTSAEPAAAPRRTLGNALDNANAPRAPGAIEATLRRWLFEGNLPVKFGIVLVFIGVASALKYAVDLGYFDAPIELRLSGIALAAVAALGWGFRRRATQPAFGLSLQGGAIGVLLLTVFAAFRLYALLSPLAALLLVIAIVAGAALLALLQNAIALAVLGFVGGYLAPVLISTGSGDHVALFSYYALLNAAVFAIAWLRRWRFLNLVGFLFTFGIGTFWGVLSYRPELFPSTEPFVVLFFAFFSVIPLLHALRGPHEGRGYVDGTLVFGTPLLAFPLQAALLHGDRMGLAYSALAVAVWYTLIALLLRRRDGAGLLMRSHAALALGFATLAVPLALSSRWTLAAWAVEGAALVWLGRRQGQALPQLAGLALQLLAAVAYLVTLVDGAWDREPGELALLNGHVLGTLLLSASALLIAWLYERGERPNATLAWTAFGWGGFFWLVLGLREVDAWDHVLDAAAAWTAFAALTLLLAAALRQALAWPRLGGFAILAALSGPPLAWWCALAFDGPLRSNAGLAWLGFALASSYALMRLGKPVQRGLSWAHVATLWSAALTLGLQGLSLARRELELGTGWQAIALGAPMALLLALTATRPALGAWPLAALFPRYAMRWHGTGVAALVLLWLVALLLDGDAAPLPYLPLLNPLDLAQLVALVLAARWALSEDATRPGAAAPLLPIAAFALASAATLRAVHHLGHQPWSAALLDSNVAQTSLTVVWAMLGVVAWVYGSRRRRWPIWLAGAIIMGVVLVKLVLVDRSYVGNLAGIVSFLAVGALLVIVGRLAPTPPRAALAPRG